MIARLRAELADAGVEEGAVDPADMDLLLVIGSAQWIETEDPAVTDLLRRADAAGLPIGL